MLRNQNLNFYKNILKFNFESNKFLNIPIAATKPAATLFIFFRNLVAAGRYGNIQNSRAENSLTNRNLPKIILIYTKFVHFSTF